MKKNEILTENGYDEQNKASEKVKAFLNLLSLFAFFLAFSLSQYFLLSCFLSFGNVFIKIFTAAASLFLIFRDFIRLREHKTDKLWIILYFAISVVILAIFIMFVGYLKIDTYILIHK